jgi:PAS domain S-box-containing protein
MGFDESCPSRLTGEEHVSHPDPIADAGASRTEDALRRSEARYRALLDDHGYLVCRFLVDGTITFANDNCIEYFGLRPDASPATKYADLAHPDDRARIESLLASVTPTRAVAAEQRMVRADGSLRWLDWTHHGLYDDRHRLLEIQAAGRDITEYKQSEEAAGHLAAIVANADDAILSKTLDGVITSWNTAAERLFGYSAADIVGRPITTIIPEERWGEERDILSRLQRGQVIDHFETERVSRDGRRIPISVTVSPVKNASGRIIGASTVARDITERRHSERDIAAHVQTVELLYHLADLMGRAQRIESVCQAAVDAVMAIGRADRASVLLFDDQGVMRFRAWKGLSAGYRAAVDGHSPWSVGVRDPAPVLVTDVLTDPSVAALRDVIASEGIRSLGFFPLAYRGRLLGKFMIYYDAPHTFSGGELRLAATIAHHVAFGLARVRADAIIQGRLGRERLAREGADAARVEAERASQAKDEFLAMLAHELRNPLGVILNAIGVLEQAGAMDGGPLRARAAIRRQTEHLAHLLDDLLDVARITSGRIELAHDGLDLRTVVEVAVDAQRPRLEAKRQRVSLMLPDAPVAVTGDSIRLQQVLGNLLNNAEKYTPTGGAIWVRLDVDGDQAILSVGDNGSGIPIDQLESIFDLFAQANPTLARTEGGLGIGLTLVKRIVELHGGGVRALSDGPDKGSVFEIRLPLAEPEPVMAVVPETPVGGKPRRVLVIEDHDDGREMLATILRMQGHDVLQAATGQQGVELAAQHAPAAVLVDIGLPDIDGYQVAHQLRHKLGRNVLLVALTGYGQARDRARSDEAGFDVHLVKPVDPARVAEVLQRAA